jgi:hypothetical protein
MQYKIVREDTLSVLWLIIIVIVFFVLILPKIEECNKKEKEEFMEKFASFTNTLSIDSQKCSPLCCRNMWPTPITLKENKAISKELKNYVPSNFTCSGTGEKISTTGCVCTDKTKINFLSSRGNNA